MKTLFLSFAAIATLSVFFFIDSDAMPENNPQFIPESVNPTDDFTGPESFAVVELFTSEGCSSCPPADKVLNSIAAETNESGKSVYALAFHVDYWDRLGWKDRFSSPTYTARQRSYAKAMGTRNVYTPQMIVNGSREFVGSDKRKATTAVAEALADTSPVHLEVTLNADKSTSQELVLAFNKNNPEAMLLNLALVESNLVTEVPRGENAGRTLQHDNVVRSFTTLTLNKDQMSGEAVLPVPEDVIMENCMVICYLQEPTSLKVLGATKVAYAE